MRMTYFLATGLACFPIALTAGNVQLGVEATAQQMTNRKDLQETFGKRSLGLGLLAEIKATPDSAFRIRFDYTKGHELHSSGSSVVFDNSQPVGTFSFSDRRYIETMSIMGDYLMSVGPSRRAYLMAGLGLNRINVWRYDTETTTTSTYTTTSWGPMEGSTGKLAYDAGVGWRFTPSASAELRYIHSGGAMSQTYGRAELAVIWKF